MLWLFVGPIGVYLLDFFCSGIKFYLLLSPYHFDVEERAGCFCLVCLAGVSRWLGGSYSRCHWFVCCL